MLVGLSCLANNYDALRYSLVPSERMLTPFKKVRTFISGNTYKLYVGISDSFNPLGTSATVNASIQLQVDNKVYPQLPINNATGGLSAILQYNRECVGQIFDQRNTMSIFNVNFNQYAGDSTISTVDAPAKCIIGFPLSRLNAPSPYASVSLMSGVDCKGTPINVLLNIGTAFNSAMVFNLIAQYTQLIEIDTMTKQVLVIA